MWEQVPAATVGQKKPADSAVHSGERQFRRLLKKLPAGAYTCDPEGLITYYNQQTVQLWVRAPKLNDPVDRFCGSFKSDAPDGLPINHDQCWMALTLKMNNEFNRHEIVIERPDGQRLTALAYANPIQDEFGTLLGAVNVLVDISDRKRAENALKEADRSKNEFLAVLAHERRNPLGPMRTPVEILRLKAMLSSEMEGILDMLDRQVQRMTCLLDDLLNIARIAANKLELRKEQIELTELLHAALEVSRPLIEDRGQELVVTAPSSPLYLDADLTRLAQVVSNVLNNASQYTESGGHIWLTVMQEGTEAVVTIRDTGIGIRPDVLPRIFEMFTQADPPLDGSPGGLGIGLTLAEQLVELHGGTISVTAPVPARGATSSFDCPSPRSRSKSCSERDVTLNTSLRPPHDAS